MFESSPVLAKTDSNNQYPSISYPVISEVDVYSV